LTRHRGVFDAFFFGEHREDRFHEGGLSGRARALNDDSERTTKETAGAGQITDESIGPLPHHAAGFEVLSDALDELRVSQKLFGFLTFDRRHFNFRFAFFFGEAVLLQAFERKEKLAEIALDDLFIEFGFSGGAFDKLAPLEVMTKVDLIEMEEVVMPKTKRDFERFKPGVSLQAAHPITPITDNDFPMLTVLLHLNIFIFSLLRRSL
jgi:hypothetical protein